MSSAEAVVAVSKRCDTTTWNASPAGSPPSPPRRPRGSRPARCCSVSRLAPSRRSTASGEDWRREVGLHGVEPGHRVRPRLVDPLVGRVVVDRVGDEQDRAVLVVEHREVGGEQHRQLGQARSSLASSGSRSSGAPRRTRGSRPCRRSAAAGRATARCAAARWCRAAPPAGRPEVGHADRGRPVHTAVAVTLGERRRRPHADEGVPRPDAAVLGRLEQEGARPAPREALVEPHRGLAVGEQPTRHGDHPAACCQRPERIQIGRPLQRGQRSLAFVFACT
jgi:hypothetical protein